MEEKATQRDLTSPARAESECPGRGEQRRWYSAFRKSYSIALLFVAWEVVTRAGLIDPFFVPPLSSVLATGYQDLLISGSLWDHSKYSFMRAILGLLLAIVTGVPIGMAMALYRPVEEFFDPLFAVLYPMPKLALFPLFLVFLGIGEPSKIALIYISCFFPILVNTFNGVKNIDKFLIWNAKTKGVTERQMLFKVALPAAMPYVFAGFRISAVFAFALIVAAEMIAANNGLGFLVMSASMTFQKELMFAGILVIAALGFIIDRLIRWVEDRTLFWSDVVRGRDEDIVGH